MKETKESITEKLVHREVEELNRNSEEIKRLKGEIAPDSPKSSELKKAEEALAKEPNLDKVSFYEGYIKGLKFEQTKSSERWEEE